MHQNNSVIISETEKLSVNFGALLEAVDIICFYYRLILLTVGGTCNPLSFIVFSRKAFRGTTISIYLRVLTVSDLGVILTGLVKFFILKIEPSFRYSNIPCKLSLFLAQLCFYTSSWVLVVMTGERVLSITRPHKVGVWCTGSTTALVLLSLLCILSIGSSPYAIVFGDQQTTDPVSNTTLILRCRYLASGKDLGLLIMISDALLFVFVPCFLLIIFNIIIVRGVLKSRKKITKSLRIQNKSRETDRDVGHHESVVETNTRSTACHTDGKESARKKNGYSRREKSLTLTLITVNTAFIVCNFPGCVWTFGPYYQAEGEKGILGYAVYNLLNNLVYTNNALNFILYCVTGSKFRSEVRNLFADMTWKFRHPL